jgi:Tol biopolymer transport system component
MQPDSVTERFSFEPTVAGKWIWEGNSIWFWPQEALKPGEQYTVRLAAGAQAENGLVLRRNGTWTVRVRMQQLAYISAGEAWLADPRTGLVLPWTKTNGQLLDFNIRRDGEMLVYAAHNEQGGADLWVLQRGRDGVEAERLLACGVDICQRAAWAPDGRRLVFSRMTAGQLPHLWSITWPDRQAVEVGELEPLVGDFATWSPDGKYLAFYDRVARSIRVLDILKEDVVLLKSEVESAGVWSPDGQHLVYLTQGEGGPAPFLSLVSAELSNDSLRLFFNDGNSTYVYGLPAWYPGADWFVLGVRPLQGWVSQQLWIANADGLERALTNDWTQTYGVYSWHPGGGWLAAQQFKLGDSKAVPQVVVWSWPDEKMYLIAENAFQPVWLP